MKFTQNDQFASWMLNQGISRDPRNPYSSYLDFLQGSHLSRFWTYPQDYKDYTSFFTSFLKLASSETGGWLYPRSGVWLDGSESATSFETKMSKLLMPAGVAVQDRGALFFQGDEIAELTKILVTLITESRSLPDPHLIPADGRIILFFDHHGALFVKFRNGTFLNPFISALENQGIHLPTEYPDTTFKPVDWMKRK